MKEFLLEIASLIANAIAWWYGPLLVWAYIPGMLWWKHRTERPAFPWRFYLMALALGIPLTAWMFFFWRPIYDVG